MPGPPPKDPGSRRRRNADRTQDPLIRLPRAGRTGATPAWPLSEASDDEIALWRELWRTPQAAAWEKLGWTRVVGRYARLCVAAEAHGAKITLAGECRQMEDRLGLSPMAMLRLRWKIDEGDEVADARKRREPSTRERLKAVDAGAVAGA